MCVCARIGLFSRAGVNYLRTGDPLSSQDCEPLLLGNHIKHSRALEMTDGKVIRNMAALRAFSSAPQMHLLPGRTVLYFTYL